MRGLRFLVLAAVAAFCFTVTAPRAAAQIAVSVGIEPGCPYGYYDAAPYGRALLRATTVQNGLTEAYSSALARGFMAREDFRGHVNNRYHPEHGYRGPAPRGRRESRRVKACG